MRQLPIVQAAVKWIARISAVALVLLAGPFTLLVSSDVGGVEWWNASREVTGLAPAPAAHPEALVQVYAARAFKWRGAFGVHTWVATKPAKASEYTVYEVIGWRARRGLSALAIHHNAPDRQWFGNAPEIIAQISGKPAEAAIEKIAVAAAAYPYKDVYTLWPGPNSNTFTAWVGRAAPELKLDLPPTAIGKDWLDITAGSILAPAPSGTGYQVSLSGLLGVLAGIEEGLELNIAGLTVGVDPLDLAVKLPGIGRLGGGRSLTPPSAAETARR
ncbi:MAG: DUF3750 domain-containing protein [Alphaproteobacteria bacterium]